MKKYQQLAERLCEQVMPGTRQPGNHLPSLCNQVVLSGMNFMTVSHACQSLENQGCTIAWLQSDYYVTPQVVKVSKATVIPVTRDEVVDISTHILGMLQTSCNSPVVPFALAFPDPRLLPL